MKVEETLFTNQVAPDPARTSAISAFMLEIINRSLSKRDPELVLNALLGAYLNIARLSGGVSQVKTADALNRGAERLLKGEPAPAIQGSVEQRLTEVHEVMKRIHAVLAGHDHPVALSALITLFNNYATQYACCTAEAAQSAAMVAAELSQRAALASHTGPVH